MMTNEEERILLNQREIMFALMNMNLREISIANGLGEACHKTSEILLVEKLKKENNYDK